VDSVKTTYSQVILVDNGGFFPEESTHQDVAWFLVDMMKTIGVDAVNVGSRDLRFGRAFLEQRVKRSQLAVTSANLLDARTRRPVFAPYLIKKVGAVNVGIFGLIGENHNLGPAADSLAIEEPGAAARRTVAELRKKGATVVVLLSQLGKVGSEDLVTAVDGIDAVVVGSNTPLLQKGRMVKNTVACYGGEQGQYACRTILSLDARKRVATGEAEAFMLGPEVGDKPEVRDLVKTFEDGFNEKLRKAEQERQAQRSALKGENSPSHFIGADLCIRCHQAEGEQWKSTSHAVAWQTLVDSKKDTDPSCVGCHVVGYQKPGGFTGAGATPQMANVQCESCHGMGTEHDSYATAHQVTQATCVQCHSVEQDPQFSYERELALILHSNHSGETLRAKKVKGPAGSSAVPAMKGKSGN
jgi:hypothetical protein